jgi:hypothetical protein
VENEGGGGVIKDRYGPQKKKKRKERAELRLQF